MVITDLSKKVANKINKDISLLEVPKRFVFTHLRVDLEGNKLPENHKTKYGDEYYSISLTPKKGKLEICTLSKHKDTFIRIEVNTSKSARFELFRGTNCGTFRGLHFIVGDGRFKSGEYNDSAIWNSPTGPKFWSSEIQVGYIKNCKGIFHFTDGTKIVVDENTKTINKDDRINCKIEIIKD